VDQCSIRFFSHSSSCVLPRLICRLTHRDDAFVMKKDDILILLHTPKNILLTHLNLDTKNLILAKNLILDTHNLNLDMKFQNLDKREIEERSFAAPKRQAIRRIVHKISFVQSATPLHKPNIVQHPSPITSLSY
jgi:hypothetical protein